MYNYLILIYGLKNKVVSLKYRKNNNHIEKRLWQSQARECRVETAITGSTNFNKGIANRDKIAQKRTQQ